MSVPSPVVAAVVVSSDGRSWLPELFDSLDRQTRPLDRIVAVDNASSDGSRDWLLERLGPDGVLPSSRDLGFPVAANMGVAAVPEADLILLVHDDVVLDDETVERLVDEIEADGRLAAVGPRVVAHDDPRHLLSLGMTLDRLGQVHDHAADQGRDQGQGLAGSRHLAITSATMLVRANVFTVLGGFDPRFEMYRDDLDLCWRMWLAGWEVAVVPTARVRHRRVNVAHARAERSAFEGPRYLQERNTLASVLKNVGFPRVVLAVLGFVAAALVRSAWLLTTRRFSESWQTLQALGWNFLNLRSTLRQRSRAQRHQRRTASQIEHLFQGTGPLIRDVAERLGDLLAGSDDTPEVLVRPDASLPWRQRAGRLVRRRPAIVTGVVLVVAGLVLASPVLLPGIVRLGELQPFPSSGLVAMRDHVAPWHDAGGVGTALAPSPAQYLVGLVQLLVADSQWAASRLLLLGLPALAWFLAQHAVERWIPTRGPRVAGATLYVASPPMIAALRGGRLSVLVAGAMIPLLVIGISRMVDRAGGDRAWRGAAIAALAGAVMVAFHPAMFIPLGIVVAWLVVFVGLRRDTPAGRGAAWNRIGLLVAAIPLLLADWLVRLLRGGVDSPSDVLPLDEATSPMWQWLLFAPDQFGFPPVVFGAGLAVAALLGIALSARRHPRTTLLLTIGMMAMLALAGVLDGLGADAPAWGGSALLLAAGAAATLFAIGLRHARATVTDHDFGWRQVTMATGVLAVVVGVAGTGVDVLVDGWALDRGRPELPEFIIAAANAEAATDAPTLGNVLMVTSAPDGATVAWDLVAPSGPTMASHGVDLGPATTATIDRVVRDIVAESDPAAAGLLGLRGVEWIVIPDAGGTEALESAFDRQFSLRSEDTENWSVFRLVSFAPAVATIAATDLGVVTASGALPSDVEVVPVVAESGRWTVAPADEARAVLLGVGEVAAFAATDGRTDLEVRSDNGVQWVDLPPDTAAVITAGDVTRRRAGLLVQVFAVVLMVSILMRPPTPVDDGSRGVRP